SRQETVTGAVLPGSRRTRSPMRSCSFSGIPSARFRGKTPRMNVGAKIAALSSSPPSPVRTFRSRAVSVTTLTESFRTTPRRIRSFGRTAFRYTCGCSVQTRSPLPRCRSPPWPATAATAAMTTKVVASISAPASRGTGLPRLPRGGEPVASGRVLEHVVLRIPGRTGGEGRQLRGVDLLVDGRAGTARQRRRIARDRVAGTGAVPRPAVLVALLVPPEVDAVGSALAPRRETHDVGEHSVAVRGV